MAISIFNMGIAIPGKTVFLIETAPRSLDAWVVLSNIEMLPKKCGRSHQRNKTFFDIVIQVTDFLVLYGRGTTLPEL